jgi:hypothetical protein
LFHEAEVTGASDLVLIENTIVHIRLHGDVVLMEMEKQPMNLAKYREPCPAKIEYFQISPIFRHDERPTRSRHYLTSVS